MAPEGKIKRVELPDGTLVWLNPGSSIIFSEKLTKEEIRDVRLWGQAYFDVAPDDKHPFVLQLGDVGLKVIGTSFNASNYKDDQQIEIALKEGYVGLFEGQYNDASIFRSLKPGQVAKYIKGEAGFQITESDINKYTSWMDGILIFRDDLMSDVFRRLERWYDVKIIVDDPQINHYLYTATIKNENLTQILNLLEFTSDLTCEIVNNNSSRAYKPTILIKTKNTK
ncbi:FecR family protein [Gaoshiqia sp. Z1-71]|uniref:FecR family protein n=1 Tax=Gaoshiqia hydrogeniformans TaxID=3290090 RepID=UPI003BF80555